MKMFERLDERYGAQRATQIRSAMAFAALSAALIGILLLALEGMVQDLDDLADARALLRIEALSLWLVMLLIALWLFVRREAPSSPSQQPASILPAVSQGGQAETQAVASPPESETHPLLEETLQANRELQERVARMGNEQQIIARSRDALLRATHEAMLLIDVSGAISGASSEVGRLLRTPRENLIGKRFEDVVPLFQEGTEYFRNYPLRNLVARVLTSGSAIPQTEQAIVLNHDNEPIPVSVTVAAVLETSGSGVGTGATVTIRPQDPDSLADEHESKQKFPAENTDELDWGRKLLGVEPFERQLAELSEEAASQGTQHSLLFVRVDDLDHINDQLGFWAGEQALWHAAKNFSMAVVEDGTGYRCSNSRFAALLIGYDAARAAKVAERIRKHAEANDLVWEGQRVSCTFSIAILPIEAESGSRAELLGAAEALLAEAKNKGGNCVIQKHPEGSSGSSRRRDDKTWLDWLLPRLENDKAHLISQEMRALSKADDPSMVEVFLRIEDDDGVWLEPGYFLPAIGRMRETARIDLWVLRKLIETLKSSPELLDSYTLVSVNLSPQTLLDQDFAAEAFEIIASATTPAKALCFEIDEAFAISHSAMVQRALEQLRPLGVRFALDRCHTTMGLTQLRHLPVDYMKIDPSVTRNVELDALDRAHLRWICDAAHLLGRKTAAINIESNTALTLLKAAGVDYVQGTGVNKFGPLMT